MLFKLFKFIFLTQKQSIRKIKKTNKYKNYFINNIYSLQNKMTERPKVS